MSSVLQSPQLATHLSRNRQCAELSSSPSRRRAQTAPSTPMYAFPEVEPFELPDFRTENNIDFEPSPNPAKLGAALLQPGPCQHRVTRSRSSPQETSCATLSRNERISVETFYWDASSTSLARLSDAEVKSPSRDVDVAPPPYVEPMSQLVQPTVPYVSRLSLAVPPPSTQEHLDATTPVLTSASGSLSVPYEAKPQHDHDLRSSGTSQSSDLAFVSCRDSALVQLQASHAMHVESLTSAHEREIASYRLYVNMLEGPRDSSTDALNFGGTLHDASLLSQQVRALCSVLQEKDLRIAQLESDISHPQPSANISQLSSQSTRILELQRELQIVESQLATRRANRCAARDSTLSESTNAESEPRLSTRSDVTPNRYYRRNLESPHELMPATTPPTPGGCKPYSKDSQVRGPGVGPLALGVQVPATPPPRFHTVSSPPTIQQRSPLLIHKRLPEPPAYARPRTTCTKSLSPSAHVVQLEGHRSFSEPLVASTASALVARPVTIKCGPTK